MASYGYEHGIGKESDDWLGRNEQKRKRGQERIIISNARLQVANPLLPLLPGERVMGGGVVVMVGYKGLPQWSGSRIGPSKRMGIK